MSATENRVEALLERWLASVDRHALYLQLDDAAYARAEAWPKHQRPNALVVNLARARLLELKSHLIERRDAGDTRFVESLELMSFLTSLLGSEHIERFIPLATGKPVDTGISATVEQPRIKPVARIDVPAKPASGTHRRPARTASRSTSPSSASPNARSPAPATSATPKPAATKARPASASVARDAVPPPSLPAVGDSMIQQVLADAARMLQWGREWPAIAGLIARMADRPSEADVWKILRAHRSQLLGNGRRTTG